MVILRSPIKEYTPPRQPCKGIYLVSLTVHFGGKFRHAPKASYLGGSAYVFDEVDATFGDYDGVLQLCRSVGIDGIKGFYTLQNGGFKLLCSTKDWSELFVRAHLHKEMMIVYADATTFPSPEPPISQGQSSQQPTIESQSQSAPPSSFIDLGTQTHPDIDAGTAGTSKEVDWDNIEIEDEGAYNSDSDDLDIFYDSDYDCASEGSERVEEGKTTDDKQFEENVDHSVDDGIHAGDECFSPDEDDNDSLVWDSEEELLSCDEEGNVKKRDVHTGGVLGESDLWDPKFRIGMLIANKKMFRFAVKSLAVNTNRDLGVFKNDKRRLHAKCKGAKCKWRLHCVKVVGEESYRVHQFYDRHNCQMTKKIPIMDARWVAKKLISKWKTDPNRDIEGFRLDTEHDLNVKMSRQQAWRAKKFSLEQLYGDSVSQYAWLWDYIGEVKRTNVGSNVFLEPDPEGGNTFFRMYVCFNALKVGFTSGCRPLIGVDGCHLKGPHLGVLLTAVGFDPNNNLYPLAWAVVTKENFDNWEWFLRLLKSDLNIEKPGDWTFVSDKQKGLLNAFEAVFHGAQHRFCVRHLHCNMRSAGFTGQAYKDLLWRAARATTVNEFNCWMKAINDLDPKATEWLMDKDPKHWSRAFFSCFPQCDTLLNNMCETFNSNIGKGRLMPILSMLLWLQDYIMKKLQENRDRCRNRWRGRICPKVKKILEKNMDQTRGLTATKSDDWFYHIEEGDGKSFAVDLNARKCGCRKWDLCGIPCKHAVSAISAQGWDVEDFVHQCYHVETYRRVYQPVIMPMNGRLEWEKAPYLPVLPPNEFRTVGRPKVHKRRLEVDEPVNKQKKRCRGKPNSNVSATNKTKMKRQQTTCKCRYCHGLGHNIKGCPVRKAAESSKRSTMTEEEELVNLEELEAFIDSYEDGGPPTSEKSSTQSKLKVRRVPNKKSSSQASKGRKTSQKTSKEASTSSQATKRSVKKLRSQSFKPPSAAPAIPPPPPTVSHSNSTNMNVNSAPAIPTFGAAPSYIPAPTLFQQMQAGGVLRNMNQTINIHGTNVHIRQSSRNQVTASQLQSKKDGKRKVGE